MSEELYMNFHSMSDSKIVSIYSDLIKEIYYRTHKCCPKCGSKSILKTLFGHVCVMGGKTLKEKIDNFKYIDKNRAKCNDCGWVGRIDNLVS